MKITRKKKMCTRCGKRRQRKSSYCIPCWKILTQRGNN